MNWSGRIALGLALLGAASGDELPAGAELSLRLQQPITSYGSKRDTGVSAIVIAPVESHGRILIPLGTRVEGALVDVKRVGLGLSRETAYLHFEFTSLHFASGEAVPIRSRVSQVDDSRESVDSEGRIRGIRATASMASILSGAAVSLGAFDPMFLLFTFSASLSAFRIPESEIVLPAGAEFRIKLLEPVTLTREFPSPVPGLAGNVVSQLELEDLIAGLPFRTATETTNLPSDLTNLAVLGSDTAVAAAFDAAGWVRSDKLDAQSTYSTMRSIVENQGYRQAPMSTLLLNGAAPRFTYSKTLDTFFKRHHVRIFPQSNQFHGVDVWTASSTHDSGIAYATAGKTFIHLIDSNIDEERDKVVHDLVLTGCVDGFAMVDRPAVPRDAKNATGDSLSTDGAIAVIRLNACSAPQRADENVPAVEAAEKGNAVQRVTRNFALTLKNDVFRGNLIYQGYSGIRMGVDAHHHLKAPEEAKTVRYAGQEFKIVRGAEIDSTPGAPHDHRNRPTFDPRGKKSLASTLEFSCSGGYSRFANDSFSSQRLDFSLTTGSTTNTLYLYAHDQIRQGFSLSPKVTLNSHRYVSHEFSFTHNDSPFRMTLAIDGIPELFPIDAEGQVRQYAYNVLIHLRPNGSRVRPYVAFGPGVQVLKLTDDTADTRSKIRFAFRDAGLFIANYRLAKLPPMEGGAIFQPSFSYGAGIKVYLTPHFLIRSDFRETISAQPDYWTKSYKSIDVNFGPDPDNNYSFAIGPYATYGPLRQQAFSFGIGFAF